MIRIGNRPSPLLSKVWRKNGGKCYGTSKTKKDEPATSFDKLGGGSPLQFVSHSRIGWYVSILLFYNGGRHVSTESLLSSTWIWLLLGLETIAIFFLTLNRKAARWCIYEYFLLILNLCLHQNLITAMLSHICTLSLKHRLNIALSQPFSACGCAW
jgi:hypothetical protein